MPRASVLKRLSALCVLTALACSTVESYTCTECSGEQCQSNQGTCTTSQGCFNNKQRFQLPGVPEQLTQAKGCSPSTCSPLSFTATLGSGRTFVYENQCCASDQCNKEDIQLPAVSKDPNGIECPACYTQDGTFCSPQPLKCTGAETKCVEVIGIGKVNDVPLLTMSGMGCATEKACNLKDTNVLQTITNIRTYCVDPISGSPPLTPIISSTLTSLLLLKILF